MLQYLLVCSTGGGAGGDENDHHDNNDDDDTHNNSTRPLCFQPRGLTRALFSMEAARMSKQVHVCVEF